MTDYTKLASARSHLEESVAAFVKMLRDTPSEPDLPNYKYNRLVGAINYELCSMFDRKEIGSDFRVSAHVHNQPLLAGVSIQFEAADGIRSFCDYALPEEMQYRAPKPKPVLEQIEADRGGKSTLNSDVIYDRDVAWLRNRVADLTSEVRSLNATLDHHGTWEIGFMTRNWIPNPPATSAKDSRAGRAAMEDIVSQLTVESDPVNAYDRAMKGL